MVLNNKYFNEYCITCDTIYTNTQYKWCKPCQVKYLKENFINWTSKNEKIDNFIQEMQLKIDYYKDIVIEWIPYNQFNNIKEIVKYDLATVSSAQWKDGPLYWNSQTKNFI